MSTFPARIKVLPRDLQPGDKVDRLDKNIDIVQATVRAVDKVRRSNRTVYRVSLVEYDALPDNRKAWADNRHLVPFILQPTTKVTVERQLADPNAEA